MCHLYIGPNLELCFYILMVPPQLAIGLHLGDLFSPRIFSTKFTFLIKKIQCIIYVRTYVYET